MGIVEDLPDRTCAAPMTEEKYTTQCSCSGQLTEALDDLKSTQLAILKRLDILEAGGLKIVWYNLLLVL